MPAGRSARGAVLFTLGVAGYVALLGGLAMGYSPEARLFPWMVILPTLALVALEVVCGYHPRLMARIDPTRSLFRDASPAAGRDGGAQAAARDDLRMDLQALGWTVGFLGVAQAIGFLPAVLLGAPVFVRWFHGPGWRVALSASTGIALFVYLVFRVLMSISVF